MSLFYETKDKGFEDALNKKKKQTPQKTETKAPYKEQIPHFTEIVPKSTTTTNKKTTSSSKKSSSSSSKKSSSSSSKTSSSKAPYKEQLPSIFTINQRIGSNNSSGNRNTSSNKSNRFSGSSAFGSTIFQPNLTSTTKKAKSSSAKTSGNSPVQLYKTKGNPSFYNDYQMRSSTNKRFAPYAAAFNKPKTINDVIQNATNGNIFSKKPDIISNDKELTDEAKTYIEKGMQTANVLDNSFVKGEKPGYYMYYELNSTSLKAAYKRANKPLIEPTNDILNIKLTPENRDSTFVPFNVKDYMTEEELYTFYYINGRDGYAKSKEYIDSLSPELEKRAFYDSPALKELEETSPIMAPIETLGSAFESVGSGAETALKSLSGKTPDYKDNQSATAIRALQKSVDEIDNPVGKVLAQTIIGLSRNAPEMFATALGSYVGGQKLGQVAGAILGVDSSIADKYAEQIENGTVAVKGSTADIVAAGVIGGVEWGLMGKGISAPLNLLKSSGAKNALKEFAINTTNNILTAAGIAVAQTTLENVADTIFLKDNSPYQQLAKDYIESGMSEEEAYNKAFKETYLTPLISTAAVGGLTGGVMPLPRNISVSADYTVRGRNIKQNGNFNDTIKQGLTYDKSTDAFKNAEQLSKKLTSGKLISDSEIGAQDVLNNIEEQKTQLYAHAYEKLTGQSIYRAQNVDNEINAYNRNGNIIISDDIDEPATALIRHEGAHGIEQAAPETYTEYTNALKNQQGFSEYVDRLRRTYEDAGLEHDNSTLESEAAADFAKNFLKDTKSLEKLTKAAGTQTKLVDRVYNAVNNLYAKLKAKGGKIFVDETTGIKVTADDLYKMKKSFEAALLEARETGYNDGSIMYSIKQNYDATKYGVKIDSELTSYLNDIGINKKIFTAADKSEIKDTIRQAYKMLDEGNVNDAEQILKEAGEYLTKKDPKAKKEDIPKQFSEKFINLYNSGRENNNRKETARLNYQDKKDYNISISGLIKNIARSERSDVGNDTVKEISQSIRNAYSELKKGGSREEAVKSIIPEAKKIIEAARTRIEDERADFVLTQIRTANVDLSAFRDYQDSNIKEAYSGLSKAFKSTRKGGIKLDSLYKELSSEYPEYFPKDISSPEDILQKVNDVYYELRDGKTIPTYRNNEIEIAARDMAEQIVDEYYNRQPAKETTEPKISQQDISKYGIDIETQFRNSGLNVDEGSIKRYSDYARKTIDDIVKSLNESIVSEEFVDPAARKYNDYAAEFNKTFDKILGDSDIEPVQKQAVAARLMDTIWTASDNAISNIQRRAQDIISYYDISKKAPDGREITETEYKKAKQVLKTCKYKSDEIKGLKLSKTYSNTGQKDFFKDEVKAEFEKRKKDFYYEGITNKETYENAVKSIALNGREKTILSLTTKENWTAEDMAKVAALVAKYQSEGKYSDAADVYILAREKATNSGQVIQSMRLFDKLSPQGKLIAFESDYNKAVDDQINSKADRDKIKEKIKEAKKNDVENRKDDENTETKRQQNLKKRSEISNDIEKNEKEIEKIKKSKEEFDKTADEISDGKKKLETAKDFLQSIEEFEKAAKKYNDYEPEKNIEDLENKYLEAKKKAEEAEKRYNELFNENDPEIQKYKAELKRKKSFDRRSKNIIKKTKTAQENMEAAEKAAKKAEDDYKVYKEIYDETYTKLKDLRKAKKSYENRSETLEKKILHAEKQIEEIKPDAKKAQDKYEKIKKEYDDLRAEYLQIKKDLDSCKRKIETLKKRIPETEKKIQETENKRKISKAKYDSLKEQYDTIKEQYTSLRKENKYYEKWIEKLNKRIPELEKKNSELYAKFKELKNEYDQKRPELEKKIQKNRELRNALKTLEKKYSKLNKKADKSILDVYTELDKVLNEAGIDHIPENILRYMRTSFAILPMLNDADTIADLIIDQSRVRKTAAGKNIKRALKNAAKRHGVEMLRETAYNQLFNMIGDFMPHSITSKVGFWYRAAMLLNPTTLIRNVLSNFVFTPVETFVNNMAVPIDMFVSLFTKQRSIGFEMPFTGYINGIRRAKLSRLEQALKVNNLLNSGNEYATPKRTLYSKAGSAVERVMGYGLSSTDEYQKGIVEQRVRKNLERINKKYSRKQNDQETEVEIDGSNLNDNINLDDYDLNYEFEISEFDPEYEVIEKTKKAIIDFHKYGFSPEDIDEVVQYEMLYRTFQDDTALSRALKGLQETGNKLLSVGKFGLGDLIIPFTQVPGNIISRSIEYSPLGYFKFISNIASIAKDNHSRHSRITPAQQRKIILSLTRPTTALGLMAAGAFLRQNNIIIGNSINNEEDYDYTNYQKAKGISDFLINLSALERLIKGEDTSPQNNDNLMDIGWLSPLNATFALGASLSDLLSPNLNMEDINNLQDLKNIPEQLFNTTKENFWEILNNVFQYGIEQARDLPALTGIYNITQNWENVNGQILPFLAAQGTDMALGFIPQVVKKAGNVMDTETRYPYKEENPYQIAIGKIYSALPFMQKRQEVPKKVDVFGDEVKSTLGETWKDIVNEYIAPGKFSTYKEKDIVPELDRLLQYSSDILPESPYTENSTTIDGIKYSFTVKGKDYEEFSKLLGTVTYDNISAFMGSDYYQYLSDNQRVENISTIVSESKTLAKQIWVKASQGTNIDEINEMKSSKAAEYKAIPAYTVKERQAKDYLMSDSAPVETIVDGYVKRYSTDWTEEEKNEKIQEYQKRINDIKAGKRYKEINGKRVYSRNWSEELKQSEIQKAQESIDKINNGETYKQEDITGVWSELTEEAQQQVLKNIEKNIEELELPEAAISTIPDMSKEDYYTESTNTGIQDFDNKSALYETRFTNNNVFQPVDNFKAASSEPQSQFDLAYIQDKASEYVETEDSKSPKKYNKSRYSGSSSGKSNKKSSYRGRKRSSGGGSGGGSSGGERTAYSIASLLNTPRFTPRSSTNSYVMPGYQAEDEYYNNGIQVASAMSYRPRFTPREQIFTGSRYQSGTRFPDRFNRA